MKARRTIAIALLAAAGVLAPATAASAGHITSKDDCKNGGFASLTDATGAHYKNQGQCVAAYNAEQKASPAAT